MSVFDLDAMDRMIGRWDREYHMPGQIVISAIDRLETLDWIMRPQRQRKPIILGGRKRTVKGAPSSKPNNRRAKVKAARKANRQRKAAR